STAYTPYQAEITQGRSAALLNFQTACIDLTGFPVVEKPVLHEATATPGTLAEAQPRSSEEIECLRLEAAAICAISDAGKSPPP
ncbi:hypothetical protein CWI56_00255, partial [Neisseria meningitidis]